MKILYPLQLRMQPYLLKLNLIKKILVVMEKRMDQVKQLLLAVLLSTNMNGLPGGMEKLADESMSYYRQMIDTWMRMVSSIGQQVLTPTSGQGSGGLWGMDGQSANAAAAPGASTPPGHSARRSART